ncbi:MAG: 50S ribosomal protein L35 [Candidatus Omnitrophica bacterium]|nr:50S ribosomal protein L35 [Candidatus Omnitrophota bacterium]
MPKLKTRKGVKKRFKITKNGKVIRKRAGKRHILTKKSSKRKRGLRKTAVVENTKFAKNIKRLLPYSGR